MNDGTAQKPILQTSSIFIERVVTSNWSKNHLFYSIHSLWLCQQWMDQVHQLFIQYWLLFFKLHPKSISTLKLNEIILGSAISKTFDSKYWHHFSLWHEYRVNVCKHFKWIAVASSWPRNTIQHEIEFQKYVKLRDNTSVLLMQIETIFKHVMAQNSIIILWKRRTSERPTVQ